MSDGMRSGSTGSAVRSARLDAALFDYGAGNLHSLSKALEAGGVDVEITRDWDRALAADILVLPGVGAFGAAVAALDGQGERIRKALEEGLPCIGICLGMQLFFEESEESAGEGIGIIGGRVRKLEARRVPQMGWNDVETTDDPLFDGVDGLVGYYANSFVCEPEDGSTVIATSEYEGHRYAAGVRKGNAWGLQFHPEKSSTKGLAVLHNFLDLATAAVAEGTGEIPSSGDTVGTGGGDAAPNAGGAP